MMDFSFLDPSCIFCRDDGDICKQCLDKVVGQFEESVQPQIEWLTYMIALWGIESARFDEAVDAFCIGYREFGGMNENDVPDFRTDVLSDDIFQYVVETIFEDFAQDVRDAFRDAAQAVYRHTYLLSDGILSEDAWDTFYEKGKRLAKYENAAHMRF